MSPSDGRRAFLSELVDYAGLFPPASLSMEAAVEEYLASRQGPHGWMLARFICPASRLGELEPRLEQGSGWRLSVLLDLPGERAWRQELDDRLGEVARFAERAGEAVRVEMAEARLPAEVVRRPEAMAEAAGSWAEVIGSAVPGARCFLEVPVAGERPGAVRERLEALAGAGGVAAKVRCGGPGVGDVPTPDLLAAFVRGCRRLGLAFKATAGLHQPFRHFDPVTGLMRHGFVNLVGAAVLAHAHGLDAGALEGVIGERRKDELSLDPEGLRWRDLRAGPRAIEQARRELVIGYGSCSFAEPVEGLEALGVLPSAA